jgi:hypothetical protein
MQLPYASCHAAAAAVQAALTSARLKAHPVSPGQQAADWVAYALAAAPSERRLQPAI